MSSPTRLWQSARTAQTTRPEDQRKKAGWGESRWLAKVRPSYVLHNLCYTKLILALFRAYVKLRQATFCEGQIFSIHRIIQDLGAVFPEKRSWCLLSLYSHEYTFSTSQRAPSPIPENNPPLAELCRIQKIPMVVVKGTLRCKGIRIVSSLCEDACRKEIESPPSIWS